MYSYQHRSRAVNSKQAKRQTTMAVDVNQRFLALAHAISLHQACAPSICPFIHDMCVLFCFVFFTFLLLKVYIIMTNNLVIYIDCLETLGFLDFPQKKNA